MRYAASGTGAQQGIVLVRTDNKPPFTTTTKVLLAHHRSNHSVVSNVCIHASATTLQVDLVDSSTLLMVDIETLA